MNAKIVLVALAALCCVQSIAAFSLAKTSPLVSDASEYDVDVLDLENVAMFVMENYDVLAEEFEKALQTEEYNGLRLQGSRGILTCPVALWNLMKTFLADKSLYDEYRQAKNARKEAENKCSSTEDKPASADDVQKCIAKADADTEAQIKAAKDKVMAQAVATITSVVAVKSCFGL